jgi:Orsellinic acid/F9775 biosynthesis cluster protein D
MNSDFHFEPSWGVIVCHVCGTCLKSTISSIDQHLRKSKHGLKGDCLQQLKRHLCTFRVRTEIELFNTHPEPARQPVEAISQLRVHSGFRCLQCPDHLTTDSADIRRHVSKHGGKPQDQKPLWEKCLLQTLFAEKELLRYFRVYTVNITTEDITIPGEVELEVAITAIDHLTLHTSTQAGETRQEERAKTPITAEHDNDGYVNFQAGDSDDNGIDTDKTGLSEGDGVSAGKGANSEQESDQEDSGEEGFLQNGSESNDDDATDGNDDDDTTDGNDDDNDNTADGNDDDDDDLNSEFTETRRREVSIGERSDNEGENASVEHDQDTELRENPVDIEKTAEEWREEASQVLHQAWQSHCKCGTCLVISLICSRNI